MLAKHVSQTMFSYTRKVTKADRERVAREVTSRFPILGNSVSPVMGCMHIHALLHYI